MADSVTLTFSRSKILLFAFATPVFVGFGIWMLALNPGFVDAPWLAPAAGVVMLLVGVAGGAVCCLAWFWKIPALTIDNSGIYVRQLFGGLLVKWRDIEGLGLYSLPAAEGSAQRMIGIGIKPGSEGNIDLSSAGKLFVRLEQKTTGYCVSIPADLWSMPAEPLLELLETKRKAAAAAAH
jgi:hypothetical protein